MLRPRGLARRRVSHGPWKRGITATIKPVRTTVDEIRSDIGLNGYSTRKWGVILHFPGQGIMTEPDPVEQLACERDVEPEPRRRILTSDVPGRPTLPDHRITLLLLPATAAPGDGTLALYGHESA
jgi:hypothetical protein